MNYVFYKSGMWVYPILEKLNWPLRVIFFIGNILYAPFTYITGEYLNNTYWGVKLSEVSLVDSKYIFFINKKYKYIIIKGQILLACYI